MNAERPPQDRSVASATGVAPAATAAAKAASTSSRVLTVQASVTPDHPVGPWLPGAASAVRSGSGKSASRTPPRRKPVQASSPLDSSRQPAPGRTSGEHPCSERPA